MNPYPLYIPQPHMKLIRAMWILSTICAGTWFTPFGLIGIGCGISAFVFAVYLAREKALTDRRHGWANIALGIIALLCFSGPFFAAG